MALVSSPIKLLPRNQMGIRLTPAFFGSQDDSRPVRIQLKVKFLPVFLEILTFWGET